jgi:hypothetical protein
MHGSNNQSSLEQEISSESPSGLRLLPLLAGCVYAGRHYHHMLTLKKGIRNESEGYFAFE